MRVGALQDWPVLAKHAQHALRHRLVRSASSRMMLADLPPSSCATRLTVSAAALATRMPARVEPVNDIMSMSGMGGHRLADRRAVAVDQVEDARRHARLVQHFGEEDGVHRRDLARLEHHGAAGGERRRDLADDLVDRPVPRRDQAADADRLARDQRAALKLLELVILQDLDHLLEVREAR